MVNDGQKFVNVVKEWPTTALPKGQRGRWKIRIREREREKKKSFLLCDFLLLCV